ncbi:MAG: hypothetical protein DLM67_06035 [Candidatus Nephthysia bennettiae]|uniref:RDD family protein n=1 Tax=Candidatus Nephthysia bennettiae TaxID=3127016 RepID=A0A934KBJ2_9BACT|nr:RDD family protein [Candidatus Dormibacteraeota bacterium]MBJ7611772.1 RDD family protein [Candidatus Dormibacteraeota bacterium]PZR98284.1 MAG: hypothetical protein DLM67_06035 [Candidatus Dormibacteraeota bacterium]
MAEPQRSPDQEFAEWYVWAKREISTDNRVCHGAAQAAVEALADGADRPTAIQAARRSQAGHSLALASQVPPLRRSYAEWYDWARREIGGDSGRLHEATHAAIDSLQRGGGSAEAAAAARSAVPLAAPPAPPPVGHGAAATPDPPPTPVWSHPGPHGAPGSPGPDPAALRAELPYAGFWRRLGAFAIDLVFVLVGCLVVTLLIAVLLAIALISSGGSAPTDDPLVQVAAFLILLVLTWLYFAGLESSGWQGTLGKRMTGLLVTDRAGRRLSFWRSTGRYFAKILSALPILIGYLLAAFTPQKQALHDLIAGTLVVKKRGFRAPAAPLSEAGHPEQTAIGGEAQRV